MSRLIPCYVSLASQKTANPTDAEREAEDQEEERSPLLANQRTYVGFRSNRQLQDVNESYRFLLTILKFTYCLLGLWSLRLDFERVLVGVICIYQAVYDFYVCRVRLPRF